MWWARTPGTTICGIAGFIGTSKHPNITYQLATRLFERSEVRGSDASGFWGCQPGDTGAVVYHKEPRRSTQFVHSDAWKRLKTMDLNILILHTRQSSQGVGDASTNRNNHPFTSTDRSIGLVHNGRILEYSTLKKRYETRSDCDSEILLRLFEAARTREQATDSEWTAPPDIVQSMVGIREIFSYANDSYMAVAIGERGEGGRRDLWLFHNEKRPLWVMDCRTALGQVFFCSSPEIWQSALRDCPHAQAVLGGKKHTVTDMPTEEIWFLSVDNNHPVIDGRPGHGYYGFKLNGENEYTPWDDDGPFLPIIESKRLVNVLTDLGPNDELTGTYLTPQLPLVGNHRNRRNKRRRKEWEEAHGYVDGHYAPKVSWKAGQAMYEDENEDKDEWNGLNPDLPETDEDGEDSYEENEDDFYHTNRVIPIERQVAERIAVGYSNDNTDNTYDRFDVEELEKTVKEIIQTARNIETSALNMANEGSLTPQQFADNLESLQMILNDLQGSRVMLDGY